MSYRYQPGPVPSAMQQIRAWLSDELRRISNAIGSADYVQLQPIDVAPAKPARGMIVDALAVNWNPGAGAGLYWYDGSSWQKVS